MKYLKPSRPMELITSDNFGPYPVTPRGNIYAQVIGDHFTKLSKSYAKPDLSANQAADAFLKFMLTYGIAENILTDQGTDFESHLIEELCELLDIHKIRSTPFHPQADGFSEALVKIRKNMIPNYVKQQGTDWDLHLDKLDYAINSAVHSTTKFTPFHLMFGRDPRIPLDLFYKSINTDDFRNKNINIDLQLTKNDYAANLKNHFEEVFLLVRHNRNIRMEKAKIIYDRTNRAANFKVGDFVLKTIEHYKPGTCKALSHKWEGPYVVLAKFNNCDYILKSYHTKRLKHESCHQNRLKRWHGIATQTAKFRTRKYRERESTKEILNTQPESQQTDTQQISEQKSKKVIQKTNKHRGRLLKSARAITKIHKRQAKRINAIVQDSRHSARLANKNQTNK